MRDTSIVAPMHDTCYWAFMGVLVEEYLSVAVLSLPDFESVLFEV